MSSEDERQFLSPKELGIYGVYAVGALATLWGLNEIGVTDLVKELGKPGELETGFVIGCAENVIAMGVTLAKLSGKINLTGTHDFKLDNDGVRVRKSTCVDGRIDRDDQEAVEPGSGLMQGIELRNLLLATMVHNGGGSDLVVGYLMGRALPAAAISTTFHLAKSVGAWFGPATREVEEPHNSMCGWTATENWGNFALKFMHAPSVFLDGENLVNRVLQIPVQMVEQAVAVPLSFFKFIRTPGGYSQIHDSH